jgi:hypothetical protein
VAEDLLISFLSDIVFFQNVKSCSRKHGTADSVYSFSASLQANDSVDESRTVWRWNATHG